jgi:ubiquitin-conjugating enzyme E2 J2
MSRQSLSRLKKEYEAIQKDPIPNAIAVPDPKNWLRWHYIIYGLDGPFASGVYYGELKFPVNYPMGPPSIMMFTPNGRFIPYKKICTSMSDFHPESWSPIWKISTIITGLISFMQDDERSSGCEITSDSHKATLAHQSMNWNLNNPTFKELFEPYYEIFVPQNPVTPPAKPKPKQSYEVLVLIFIIATLAYAFKQ